MARTPKLEQATLRCGDIEPFTFGVLGWDDLEKAPDAPGWYVWSYAPYTQTDLKSEIYRSSGVGVTVGLGFCLSYEGTVVSKARPLSEVSDAAFQSIRGFCLAVAPPLYIGISKSLARRLSTHKKQVLEHSDSFATAPEELGSYSQIQDSDSESEYFGARIAKALGCAKANHRGLFVRYAEGNFADLRKVERVLNSCFAPPYGIR